MYFLPASCAAATDLSSGHSARTFASFTSIGRLMPATTSTFGRFITEIERLDGVPPNISVRITTPSPTSARFTASMMSRRRCSTSSSGPMVTVSICFCSPTTCSSAARNSTASRPWVTSTKPIIGKSETPAGALRLTAQKRAIMTMCGASARGSKSARYIFRSAIGKAKKGELLVRFTGAQRSKEHRKWVVPGRDRKSREGYARHFRYGGFRGGEACRIGRRQVDHEPHDGQSLERHAADSKPAHFDQAGECLCRSNQETTMDSFQMHAVVANKAREGKRARSTALNERD